VGTVRAIFLPIGNESYINLNMIAEVEFVPAFRRVWCRLADSPEKEAYELSRAQFGKWLQAIEWSAFS
jgi:hypothetical protein